MRNHDLVAFYQSNDMADHAHDELIAAGFDQDDVKVYDNTGGQNDGGGFWESIKEAFGFVDEQDRAMYAEAARRGASAVAVSLDDDESPSARRAVQVLQRYQPMDLDQQAAQWRQQGWAMPPQTQQQSASQQANAERTSSQQTQSQQTASQQSQPRQASTARSTAARGRTENLKEGKAAIPVVNEELRVGKRRVEGGGVRLYSHVSEKPVEEQVQLHEEHVSVDRRPANRPASSTDKAFQERAIEATEMREEAVVDKQARVVEEVSLKKDAQDRTKTVRDTVRHTDVEVEPIGQPGRNADFVDTFASQLAADERYRGREWTTIEPEARRSFEQRYPNSKWDQFRDAIRTRWDRARSRT
jgi:uncharacterized protein (TIGR02271 family)